MKLTFIVNYRTEWGEMLYLTGTADALGAGDESKAIPMTLSGEETWTVTADIPEAEAPFSYSYIVRHDNGRVRREWGRPRTFKPEGVSRATLLDRWQDSLGTSLTTRPPSQTASTGATSASPSATPAREC